MPASSKQFLSQEQKLEIVLESFQRDTIIEAACRKFGLVRLVICRWRDEFSDNAPQVFIDKDLPRIKPLVTVMTQESLQKI